jgi:hypothetical protein
MRNTNRHRAGQRDKLSDTLISLETILRASSRALVVGVGGGGDVVGALAIARFLQFCNLQFVLGGLSWEQPSIDPLPGPRSISEVLSVRKLHRYAWLANSQSRTLQDVRFAESRMAEFLGNDVLLVDINGGVKGVVEGLTEAASNLRTDLFVGVDVGGDSLATGHEPGLRSPLADSMMLAAFARLQEEGHRTLWVVLGYGSDGEMSVEEIEVALSSLARNGGYLGAWGLTQSVVSELEKVIQFVPTEASAIPVRGAKGDTGEVTIREMGTPVKLTVLASVAFFLDPSVVYGTLSLPARAVRDSTSINQANHALRDLGLVTELDFEQTLAAKRLTLSSL